MESLSCVKNPKNPVSIYTFCKGEKDYSKITAEKSSFSKRNVLQLLTSLQIIQNFK